MKNRQTQAVDSQEPALAVSAPVTDVQIPPPQITRDEETGKYHIKLGPACEAFSFGTGNRDLVSSTVSQVAAICTLPEGMINAEAADATIAAIVEAQPKDSTELLLASQMAVVHMMAMEMSTRAMIQGQTVDGVDRNINRVTKLMRTFTSQVEALNKYRTKGQQKITVQHVNVEDGGQAIVGDVNQGGGNG
jgi:hypothetical protein